MQTELIYLKDFTLLQYKSRIMGIEKSEDGRESLVLNETIFYPQGGGQPCDTGRIANDSGVFIVQEVRWLDGIVRHFGNFERGTFSIGEEVTLKVDSERRELHCRIHSAGHIVDFAIWRLSLSWIPGKGYHFPNGPYVEYEGSLEGVDKETLKKSIEDECSKIVQENLKMSLVFTTKDELGKYCKHVPTNFTNLAEGKPIRVVSFGDFGVPCGGTHISGTSEAGRMTIKAIKKSDSGGIKVSYNVE